MKVTKIFENLGKKICEYDPLDYIHKRSYANLTKISYLVGLNIQLTTVHTKHSLLFK